ncbi:MAG: hypothetical protein AB7E70_12765 [Hyphomicrobiaceae bacterium]
MKTILSALLLSAGVAVLSLAPVSDALAQSAKPKKAKVTKAKSGAKCVTRRGKGQAPTESMARFQAWEIVAQTTGNWPIQTDTFRRERYKCSKTGAWGWTCYSWIDVCKK